MRSGELSKVISDCYQFCGRKATIDLLDEMKRVGFHQSTSSGLSFAVDDLITPDTKGKIIGEAEKEVLKNIKRYQRGIITDRERYGKVLDAWTHARERITTEMMSALQNDVRPNEYVNPIFLMAHSGARGGVEQIRQLGGMRGLMAKPNGEIIETPIKANFREGLSVLEYFSSTHGARKGLADTALKTADSGYLTRKLADVAQNVVITQHDCGTIQGITKGVIYRGEKVEVRLADAIRGRVSRNNIVNLITDDVIVRENEMIDHKIARDIEALGLKKIQVRSPLTCEASLGICQLCYGMDLSSGSLVEEGMAVGIVAAQSIGEPGTQLTMRTFHIGGTATRVVEDSDLKATKKGKVRFTRLKSVRNDDGKQVALSRNGVIVLLDEKDRELDKYEVPAGAQLLVSENDDAEAGQVLCQWDPLSIPILAESGGRVRYEDLVEGETMRTEKDPVTGHTRRSITEHKGDLHPQIILEDAGGKILDFYYLPERAYVEVDENAQVSAGSLLAKTPREVSGTQDITGGLPRVTEIFEARRPKDPAVIAEIDGKVEILGERRRGKRTIIIRSEGGLAREHLITQNKHLRVHSGDYLNAGTALVDGPLVPHDILRVSGVEEVQNYLVREIQNVYRAQRVEIDVKHI
ncbi:MAG: DNA-directed RNA polymerase subunit beta', partial [Planctomycetales bacterium]